MFKGIQEDGSLMMTNNSYLNTRRISPLSSSSSYSFSEASRCTSYYSDITFIRKTFYIVSYAFPSFKQRKLSFSLLWKLLEYASTAILATYVIGDFKNLVSLTHFLPAGLIFSSLLKDSCSIAVRIILLRKRYVLVSTMKHLLRIQCQFQQAEQDKKKRRRRLMMGFICCFIIPGVYYVRTIQLCYTKDLLTTYVEDSFFGWSSADIWTNCLALCALDFVILVQKYAVPGFCVVLSCYVFGLVRRILDSFATNLRQKRDDPQVLFSYYLKFSYEVYACVLKVEEAFSALLLVLYGYMIFSIFDVTTLLIRINKKTVPFSALVPSIVSLFVVFFGFCFTSIRAIAIHESAVAVRNCVHGIIARSACLEEKLANLLLITVTEFPNRIAVTGGGLFTLNRSFIQKTAGGMITYGALLSQVDKYK